jgi:acyl-CoA thioester hydrolase
MSDNDDKRDGDSGNQEDSVGKKPARKPRKTPARKGATAAKAARARPRTGKTAARAVTAGTAPPLATCEIDEASPVHLLRTPLSVRWRDLDAFNHVNNSKYLSYLEEARLRWMMGTPGQGLEENIAPVVAAAHLNYRRPIEWPAEVAIELFVERLGTTSLTMGHRIVAADNDDVLYCDGNVVMVWIDRTAGRAAALPDAVREACTRPHRVTSNPPAD